MSFWHFGNLPGCVLLLYYVSYVLFLGEGLLVSGGVGVPFSSFKVFSGGFPAWGRFSNIRLDPLVVLDVLSHWLCPALLFW